jgi:hypothetical protein
VCFHRGEFFSGTKNLNAFLSNIPMSIAILGSTVATGNSNSTTMATFHEDSRYGGRGGQIQRRLT